MVRATFFVLLLVIVIALPVASAIEIGTKPGVTYAGQWGSFGNNHGQFSNPQGIAIGPDGIVYVLDTGNNRVQVFNATGTFLRQWGRYGQVEGQFNAPLGIAVDTESNVYIADTQNHRVQKFRSSGEFVTSWGSIGLGEGRFQCPSGIAVNATGTVFVTDRNNHRVQAFTPSGSFLSMMGGPGTTGEGQFAGPTGIAVDVPRGVLLVSDPSRNCILQFMCDGEFIGSWGTRGSGDRQFYGPIGVAVASDGTIFVCDSSNQRVQGFAPDGRYLLQWGSEGTGMGEFSQPTGIAVAPDGQVYIIDQINRVQRFVPRSITTDTLIAAFGASVQRGRAPLTVQFLDESNGATAWSWSFGDGTQSEDHEPVHTYTSNGLYEVSLTVTGRSGEKSTAVKSRFVYVSGIDILRPSIPAADFEANRTVGSAPFAVEFSDASTGSPGFWWWQFGDGTGSIEQNPAHVYQRPGMYDITLTVFGEGGSDAVTRSGLVTVLDDPRVPVANFSMSRDKGSAPLYVRFTDRSTGATSWRWEFGGMAWTTAKDPSVVFRRPGTYTIRLVATNTFGSSSATRTLSVSGPGAGVGRVISGLPVQVVG